VQLQVVAAATTRELRRAVLRPGWPVGSVMPADDEPGAVHIAAVDDDDDGTVLGAAVVIPRPYPSRPDQPGAWQLRGMATAADRQGQGIGALVLTRALEVATERGARGVWCDARTSALAFYRRQGFVPDGDEFEQPETGIPHYRMWRDVAG
jgi:GNAT superfamily N-acetyltransferase